MPESIRTEHTRLLRQMDELREAHKVVERSPDDLKSHREHRARLHTHIVALRAHLTRLQHERPK